MLRSGRPQFRGTIKKSPVTGIQKMVHKEGISFYRRQTRIVISWLTSFAMIFATVSAAINAYLVREIGKGVGNYTADFAAPESEYAGAGRRVQALGMDILNETQELCLEGNCTMAGLEEAEAESAWEKNKFKWGSSVVSLFCIQIASRTYKPMAVKLTSWENHRTQTEYDDSLIIKNFMFEFLNNYFTLFFIAFLMDIDIPFKELWDWISESFDKGQFPNELTGCPGTSCIGTLKRQLATVFTLKQTISLAKQYIKPKMRARGQKKAEEGDIKKKNKDRDPAFQYPLTLDNAVEAEKFLAPYDSNFDDFKEMSIQVILPTAPAVSNEGRSSPLLALAPLFLGPEFQLAARWNRLVETVKTRKKREKTGKKWARYGLKRDKESGSPGLTSP